MGSDGPIRSRRRFLRTAGSASLVGVTGCLGGEEDGGSDGDDEQPDRECLESLSDSVPEVYETAQSIDGIQRNPDELQSKADGAYQCHTEGFQLCANCRFFVPSNDDDGVGACTEIAGEIASQHWCALYQPTERLDEPPAMDPSGPEDVPGKPDDGSE